MPIVANTFSLDKDGFPFVTLKVDHCTEVCLPLKIKNIIV